MGSATSSASESPSRSAVRRPADSRASHASSGSPGARPPRSSPRRTISFSVNARPRTSGPPMATASCTWLRAMPMTMSASATRSGRRRRERCPDVSSPRSAITARPWSVTGFPSKSRPADDTVALTPASSRRRPRRAAAIGERQVFPVQSMRISIGGSCALPPATRPRETSTLAAMCGVVAVLRRRSTVSVPDAAALVAGLDAALERLAAGPAGLSDAAAGLEELDGRPRGPAGVRIPAAPPELAVRLEATMAEARSAIAGLEADLDAQRLPLTGAELEAANAAIVRLKDAVWAIASDRLRAAREVTALAAGATAFTGAFGAIGDAALEAYWAIYVALSAIDRLEVRGRDSAGLHLLVTGHGLDPSDPEIAARATDPLFRSGSVRVVPDAAGGAALAFVYKAAAEIGELGDNVRAVRAAIAGDDLLRRALASPDAEVTVVGHTRWASVGLISEANAHPLNSEAAFPGDTPEPPGGR